MEKIEKFFIYWAILILSSYLLVYVGNQGNGLLCSICGWFGHLFQFPTSFIDLLIIYFKADWLINSIICLTGIFFFIYRKIRNN